MSEKKKKLGRQNYDWCAISFDYITTPKSSIKYISEKYQIRNTTVSERCRAEGWVEKKKDYQAKMVSKAIEKSVTKQSTRLAKLIDATDRLTDVIIKATADDEQFNRHIVSETVQSNGELMSTQVEKVMHKVDIKAVKDAAATVKILEDLQRSLNNLQKPEQINREKREAKKLELEEKRFEIEQKRAEAFDPDNTINVVIGGYQEGWDE